MVRGCEAPLALHAGVLRAKVAVSQTDVMTSSRRGAQCIEGRRSARCHRPRPACAPSCRLPSSTTCSSVWSAPIRCARRSSATTCSSARIAGSSISAAARPRSSASSPTTWNMSASMRRRSTSRARERGSVAEGPSSRSSVTDADLGTLGEFDLVLAMSLLHHLSDTEADHVFGLGARALADGGRMFTNDPCLVPGQSPHRSGGDPARSGPERQVAGRVPRPCRAPFRSGDGRRATRPSPHPVLAHVADMLRPEGMMRTRRRSRRSSPSIVPRRSCPNCTAG